MEFLCPIFVLAFVGLMIYGAIETWQKTKQEQARLVEAKRLYDESLAALTASPADPELRKRALDLGRVYSNLNRDSKGVTIYDEVALSNDIGAACAATEVETSRHAVVEPVAAKADVVERLRTLNDLKSNGLVAEDEFNSLRDRKSVV